MLKSVKLIAILCFALFLQFTMVAPAHAQFQNTGTISGGPKQDPNERAFQLRPGETILAEVVLRKNFIGEQVNVNVTLSPLKVSQFASPDRNATQDPANHHIMLMVTAPSNTQLKSYGVTLTANNGRTTTRTQLNFEVTNNAPLGSSISNATLIPFPESLYINGSGFVTGFGSSPRVFFNDIDVTDSIKSFNDGFISIETGGNKFQYRKGGNEVMVVTDGHLSNRFVVQ